MVDRPKSIEGVSVTEKASKDVGIDQRLVHLAKDAVRLETLVLLNERTASVAEVAEKLEVDESTASEHLEQMLEAGLIEVADEVTRRGELTPRYRALVRALLSDEEWATLSVDERRRLSAWIVEMINSDISEAIVAGTFGTRPDAHASRTISLVDEQGWRELTRIQDDALEASFAIQTESGERLAESGAEGMSVLSAMFCCELPGRGAD
jgi:predicted transcriptional regulator